MIGILINSYNESDLLARALKDLFNCYNGDYCLWIDDDGSDAAEYNKISELSNQYNAILTISPHKKGRSNPYHFVREMEIYMELIQKHNVTAIVRMDADTTVYSHKAFAGPETADIYGCRKNVNFDSEDFTNTKKLFESIGYRMPTFDSYPQGGFYVVKPKILLNIINSDVWGKFLDFHPEIDYDIFEDRVLISMIHIVGGKVEFWNKGFFHGAKKNFEYQGFLFAGKSPFHKFLWKQIMRSQIFLRRLRAIS